MKFGLTEAELVERRKGVGGSDVAAIIEGKWYDLWLDKLGRGKSRRIMSDWNLALRHTTETLQLDWYEHANPGFVVARRGDVVVSNRDPFMRCTLDGMIFSAEDRHQWLAVGIPINAKHVSKWTKDAREWAVQHYTPQATHEAIVCGADYALLSLLHGEKEPEIIRIDVDPMFAAELIEKERAFWGYVEREELPPDAPATAVPMMATEVRKLREVTVNLNPDAPPTENWHLPLVAEVTRFTNTHGAATVNTLAREKIKELLPEDVGACHVGLVDITRSKVGAVTISLKRLAEMEAKDAG